MDVLILIFKEVLYLGAMASVLVALLLVLKRLFRRALSPKWQYYLWSVLLLRLLIPFQPPSTLSIYNVFYAAAEQANLPITAVVAPLQNPQTAEDTIGANQPDISAVPGQNETSGSPELTNGGVNQAVLPEEAFVKAAAVIWLGGMAALGLYTAIINIAFAAAVRRRYVPLRSERMERILKSCQETLHIRRVIPLLATGKARTPSLYGLLKPKILICADSMEQLGDDEVRYVFLHELSHYKRKDIAVNWLLTLLQLVYFFNPLIWYAFHKIREDGEVASDAAALEYLKPGERQAYGGTILKLIRLVSESSFIPVTAGMSKNTSGIKRRILMIASFKKSRWTGALLAIVLIAAAALIGLTGCADTAGVTTPDTSPDSTVSGSPVETASPDVSTTPDDETVTTSPDNSVSPTPTNGPVSPVPSEPRPSEAPTPSPVPGPSEAPMPSSETYPTAVVDIFKSDWVVSNVLAYGSVGTYSKEDAEKLIGKTLSFSSDLAIIINDQPSDSPAAFKNPEYEAGTISRSDFQADFKISFDKLGLTVDSAPLLVVTASTAAGCILLVKNADTMILYAGGTFFELTRSK